jgi:RNA polymerase sigma-70 factor (ECF subfamily)
VDDEGALVRRLRAGDESAFAALVRQYHPVLVRLAMTVVGSRAIADEVVQDTWLAVVRGVGRFEGRSAIKTWLFHILFNRARTAAGRERRSDPIDEDVLAGRFDRSGEWSAPPAPWTDTVDDHLAAESTAPLIRELIDGLPDTQRQVILLRDVEGVTATDVGSLLGISAANQRVLLHRARAKVRAGLEARWGTT